MIKIAIRDDDMNFFTKVEDIKVVYKNFNYFPISFAVVPMFWTYLQRGRV